jgi:hypothetical protein
MINSSFFLTLCCLGLIHCISSFAPANSAIGVSVDQRRTKVATSMSNDGAQGYEDNISERSGACRIYFDLTVQDEPAGRLIFQIPQPYRLPIHTENILKLVSKAQTSIDPRCSYVGCEFSYSPQFIEGRPQYRWAHVLKGKGKNAVGRLDELIREADGTLQQCTHSIYGGTYYGLKYDEIPVSTDEESNDTQGEIVLLTVPLAGPGRGSTGLSIVRVSESPKEWKERLLVSSAVLGWLEPPSLDTLRGVAQQTQGPPVVSDTGILDS